MKALYIPVEGDIEHIDIPDDYRAINAKIGCRTMDVVETDHLAFFVDDEGLLVDHPRANYRATDLYWVDGGYRGQALFGNVIVAGPADVEGKGTDFQLATASIERWHEEATL